MWYSTQMSQWAQAPRTTRTVQFLNIWVDADSNVFEEWLYRQVSAQSNFFAYIKGNMWKVHSVFLWDSWTWTCVHDSVLRGRNPNQEPYTNRSNEQLIALALQANLIMWNLVAVCYKDMKCTNQATFFLRYSFASALEQSSWQWHTLQ